MRAKAGTSPLRSLDAILTLMRGTLLIAGTDRDPSLSIQIQALADHLSGLGHTVVSGVDAATALARLERSESEEFDVVLLASGGDLSMLTRIKARWPDTEVILLAAAPGVEEVAEAMRQGAFHFQAAPLAQEKIAAMVQKALEKHMLAVEVRELRDQLRSARGPRLIGESPAMQALKKDIGRVAQLDCTVLILGETGTGKELVARTIHQMSPRADKKFLAVNCAALTEELLANELFGHEREAFTGAARTKRGLFEAAPGGSILLDEVGDMPLAMQPQLLRVLQEKALIRVGGTEEIPVDVRVIAATHHDLRREVGAGVFREDLYYRLNVFSLRLPPLRERCDDIPLFVRHFLDTYSRKFGRSVERVSDEVMSLFLRYPFPGNVRELENAIERGIALCDGVVIRPEHLPRRMRGTAPADSCTPVAPSFPPAMLGGDLPTLARLEADYIRQVLARTGGNKSEAARILGIDRSSLWRKLKRLGDGQTQNDA